MVDGRATRVESWQSILAGHHSRCLHLLPRGGASRSPHGDTCTNGHHVLHFRSRTRGRRRDPRHRARSRQRAPGPRPRALPDLGRRQHQRVVAHHGRLARGQQRAELLAGPAGGRDRRVRRLRHGGRAVGLRQVGRRARRDALPGHLRRPRKLLPRRDPVGRPLRLGNDQRGHRRLRGTDRAASAAGHREQQRPRRRHPARLRGRHVPGERSGPQGAERLQQVLDVSVRPVQHHGAGLPGRHDGLGRHLRQEGRHHRHGDRGHRHHRGRRYQLGAHRAPTSRATSRTPRPGRRSSAPPSPARPWCCCRWC